MTPEVTISQENGEWILTTKSGLKYIVTSINEHCTNKLRALHESAKAAFITLEKITEYVSYEYRCKISNSQKPGWQDDDVYCLVEETV